MNRPWKYVPLLLLLLALLAAAAHGQDLGEEPPAAGPGANVGELLGELEADLGSGWWNENWRYRWKLSLDDPKVLLHAGRMVLLEQPEPLLLVNTGRALGDGADVRVLAARGEVLPAGVINLPRDDGTCRIWCTLPKQVALPLQLWVYAGNAQAQAHRPAPLLDKRNQPPVLTTQIITEESAAGAAEAGAGDFFQRIVVLEAEQMLDAEGEGVVQARRGRPATMFPWRNEAGSGGVVLCPYKFNAPFRPLDPPMNATASLTIPQAGAWRLAVRYKTNEERSPMGSFALSIAGQSFRCGSKHPRGLPFAWDLFEVELPAGPVEVKLTFDQMAGADVVLLTQDRDYLPDHRDFSGAPWMRFRLVQAPADPGEMPGFFELFAVHTPWSTHGPQGSTTAFLADEQVVRDERALGVLAARKRLTVAAGQWTPWVQAMQSSMPYWWNELRPVVSPPGTRTRLSEAAMLEFQFATRPVAQRVFNSGRQATEQRLPLRILMPTSVSAAAVARQTITFEQWAQRRLGLAESAGFSDKVDPAPFVACFMAHSNVTNPEMDLAVRSAAWLGFNVLDIGHSEQEVRPYAQRYGLPEQTVAHHWHPKPEWPEAPRQPAAGQNYEQAVKAFWADWAARTYHPEAPLTYSRKHAKLIIMGDEVGPVLPAQFIEALPLMLGHFREYLAAQGLEPGFFGKKTWEEVLPLSYGQIGSRGEAVLKQINPGWLPDDENEQVERDRKLLEGASLTNEEQAAVELPAPAATQPEGGGAERQQADMAAEENRASQEYQRGDIRQADLHEKRLYHWTQKYRGYLTCLYYQASTQAIREAVRRGVLVNQPLASPNFQAMPVHKGRQWDGALNIFDLARSEALDFLQVEDWSWTPYKIAFGMTILRSAAARHGQPIGALITGGNPLQRYLMDLGQGSRSMFSYLYGPLRVIGPPWGDDADTYRQFGAVHRALAKLGPDLLACRNRPADVAILMANTTEMNHGYHPHNIWERQNIFAALAYERWAVDVVSEEQLLEEPDALRRYRVLYVGDPHVDSRAQQRIAKWVEAGGILWSFYGGLSRQEYDEPATIMNPVFGLSARDEPPLSPVPPDGAAKQLTIAASDLFAAVALTTLEHQPRYELNGAAVLAKFPDGSPAILRHAYGKGQAFLLGFSSRHSGVAPRAGRMALSAPELTARHQLTTAAAALAGLSPHARCDAYDSLVMVHDGPGRTVAYVIATDDVDHPAVKLAVQMPQRPVRVVTGERDDVPFTWENGWAELDLALSAHRGAIVVLHHGPAAAP